MADINGKLRGAAKSGSKYEFKALLQDPGCDALSKGQYGLAALMLAAGYGHEGCVRLLLPASDVLSTNKTGKTSSAWARNGGHESLAQFIDAYVLAQGEHTSIESAASPGAPRPRAALRV